LAAAIKAETDVEAELIRGGGGIFEVTVDGERVFSKKSEGRFPEADEILARLRS
jgi:selT/selW/selH-like putative selenoprotein